MIALRKEVKEIIEKYIKLIEVNEWDMFFERIQEEWIPQVVGKVAETLESAGIFPLPHMTFIPEGYFYMSLITDYIVPNNITRICYKAFAVSDIEKIQITSNVYDINQGVFEGCSYLTTVQIDEGVKYIDDTCFYACEELTDVTLPKSLKRIGHNVFNGCDHLTEVKYNGTIEDWNKIINREFINEGSYISKVICSDGTILL